MFAKKLGTPCDDFVLILQGSISQRTRVFEKSRGWFHQFFLCTIIFTPICGKIPILTYIFQLGRNHHLENTVTVPQILISIYYLSDLHIGFTRRDSKMGPFIYKHAFPYHVSYICSPLSFHFVRRMKRRYKVCNVKWLKLSLNWPVRRKLDKDVKKDPHLFRHLGRKCPA